MLVPILVDTIKARPGIYVLTVGNIVLLLIHTHRIASCNVADWLPTIVYFVQFFAHILAAPRMMVIGFHTFHCWLAGQEMPKESIFGIVSPGYFTVFTTIIWYTQSNSLVRRSRRGRPTIQYRHSGFLAFLLAVEDQLIYGGTQGMRDDLVCSAMFLHAVILVCTLSPSCLHCSQQL